MAYSSYRFTMTHARNRCLTSSHLISRNSTLQKTSNSADTPHQKTLLKLSEAHFVPQSCALLSYLATKWRLRCALSIYLVSLYQEFAEEGAVYNFRESWAG